MVVFRIPVYLSGFFSNRLNSSESFVGFKRVDRGFVPPNVGRTALYSSEPQRSDTLYSATDYLLVALLSSQGAVYRLLLIVNCYNMRRMQKRVDQIIKYLSVSPSVLFFENSR